MKDWILSIGAVIFLTVIAGYIIPEGKLGKYVKGVFSILILFVIIKPVLSYDVTDLIFSSGTQQSVVNVQTDYLDYVFDKRTEDFEAQSVKEIENLDVLNAIVKIEYEITNSFNYNIKSVTVNLQNAVINSDKEHIVIIEEIKKTVSGLLAVGDEFISVYV